MAETAAQKVTMIDHSKFGNAFCRHITAAEEIDMLFVRPVNYQKNK